MILGPFMDATSDSDTGGGFRARPHAGIGIRGTMMGAFSMQMMGGEDPLLVVSPGAEMGNDGQAPGDPNVHALSDDIAPPKDPRGDGIENKKPFMKAHHEVSQDDHIQEKIPDDPDGFGEDKPVEKALDLVESAQLLDDFRFDPSVPLVPLAAWTLPNQQKMDQMKKDEHTRNSFLNNLTPEQQNDKDQG